MTRVRVGELIELQRRKIEVDPLETYEEIGVRSFGRGIFHKEPVTGATLGAKRVFHIRPGDLVFNNVFAWEGAVALAGASEAGKCGSHRFLTYTARSDDVDLAYLLYLFLSEPGLAAIGVASPGSAGRNRTLAIERFENLEVSVPDLAVQQQRVRRLEATYRRLQRIDRDAAHADVLVAGLRAAALRPTAPKVALGAVLEQVVRAEEVDAAREYRQLGVRSFGLGCFDAGRRQGAETRYRLLHRVAAGDLVYPKLMAWEGAFAVVPERLDGYFVSPEFCTFRTVGEKLNIGYLGALFRVPKTWASIAGSSIGTNVRRKRLYPKDFLVREIPLPDLAEQERIAALGARLDEMSRLSTRRGGLAAALRVSALNDAFRAAA